MTLPGAFTEVAAKVRNWGRWGDGDERGTLNLIDADAVRRGVGCARTGRTFPLAIPLSPDGPQIGAVPGRGNPRRQMTMLGTALADGEPDGVRCNDDAVEMGLQAATHWDALAHVSYRGVIWNGFGADTVTEAGAARCGIDKVGPLVSRGVLLDLARAGGVDRLPGGTAVTARDLDAAADHAGVHVQPGDIVLLRTGQMQLLLGPEPDRLAYTFPAAGPSIDAVPWFRAHDVAAVAIDNMTFEVYPWEDESLVMPVHLLDLVDMGLTQGQNWNLEALADDCAGDGVYSFLLEATPEPFTGGLGGPVSPVAVK